MSSFGKLSYCLHQNFEKKCLILVQLLVYNPPLLNIYDVFFQHYRYVFWLHSCNCSSDYHRPSHSLRCPIVIDTRFRTFLHLLRRCVFNIWRGRKNDSAFIVILKCIWRQVGFCALSSVLQSCISLYGQKIEK